MSAGVFRQYLLNGFPGGKLMEDQFDTDAVPVITGFPNMILGSEWIRLRYTVLNSVSSGWTRPVSQTPDILLIA